MSVTPLSTELDALPPPRSEFVVAVYGFKDLTGQRKPSDTVADILAGGGYYSEILSGIVGAEGQVLHTSSQPLQSKGSGTLAAAQTDAMAGLMKAIADLVVRDVPLLPVQSATERLDTKNGQ